MIGRALLEQARIDGVERIRALSRTERQSNHDVEWVRGDLREVESWAHRLEEAGAHIELGPAFSMVSVPYVNQVHVFFRAQLLDLEFKPGVESLEVALFEEARMPWKDIAFRTVGLTLKRWFADRVRGSFGFHAEDLK